MPRHIQFSSLCSFVHSFVRDSVPFVELLQSFTLLKFLKWGISQEPFIRNHSCLDHRYPVGSAFSPWLLSPGSMPQGGARGQNLGHHKKVFFYWCMNIILWDYESVWNDIWPQNKCRSLWPIFHGLVILPFSLKTFDKWMPYFGIMSQYDLTYVWPKNICRTLWLIFHGPLILP